MASTVATAGLLLLHVKFLFGALAGCIVAINLSERPPTASFVDSLFNDIETDTVTSLQATCPKAVIALMVVVPIETAVTLPSAFTVATAGLSLSHVTLVFVALWGNTVAINVSELP